MYILYIKQVFYNVVFHDFYTMHCVYVSLPILVSTENTKLS